MFIINGILQESSDNQQDGDNFDNADFDTYNITNEHGDYEVSERSETYNKEKRENKLH